MYCIDFFFIQLCKACSSNKVVSWGFVGFELANSLSLARNAKGCCCRRHISPSFERANENNEKESANYGVATREARRKLIKN
jgi:hypothetical protein